MTPISPSTNFERALLEKIRSLPPDKITQVEDFVDFLLQRSEEDLLTPDAAKLSEDVFAEIWNNPEDAVYDEL